MALDLIATSTMGLEAVLARELKALGYDNRIVDTGQVLFVGEVSEKARALVANTWECLEKAIAECVKPGVKYRDVGSVIQKHATTGGYSVVRSYCGHGIHK